MPGLRWAVVCGAYLCAVACGPSAQTPDADEPVGQVCEPETKQTGDGTYYDADGSGACSFASSPDNLRVAAMNGLQFANAAVCGACVAVEGPQGSITVRIVDQCPECASGDLDLSREAFAALAPLEQGRVSISWRFVPCDVSGPLVFHFKEGSNAFWSAVQVRNHRHRIERVEFKDTGGQWVALTREPYNYFVAASGMGPGPYTLRVTDLWGNVLEDSGVRLVEAGDAPGHAQLPACR